MAVKAKAASAECCERPGGLKMGGLKLGASFGYASIDPHLMCKKHSLGYSTHAGALGRKQFPCKCVGIRGTCQQLLA